MIIVADLPSCTKVFTKTINLPCAHLCQQRFRENNPLKVNDFEKHWHVGRFNYNHSVDSLLLLRDPVARPRKNKNKERDF
jgi:hypothetical protein